MRSLDPQSDSTILGANDTAVAAATALPGGGKTSLTAASGGPGDGSGGSVTELIGVTLSGRYLVTRKVGQGGMGAVYEATHTLIGKRVAVKVLLEKYARREAIVQRLEQEARLASSCQNEHIIDITDFGTTEDGRTFVVMEYLEGESLSECLARETQLSEQRTLQIISQAASALAAAHAKGIVHRDIKPENLFLLRRKDADFVKVVDFGISKSLRASDEADEPPRLTQTGMVLGTPLYMSPEQARGEDELDARVDIYALGVIMYEATTGRVPFVGNNYLSVISQVLNEEPRPLRELRPDLSEEFEALVMRAMAKDRDDRYPSAGALLDDITALLEDPQRSTERAKITGPRRKVVRTRSPLKIAVWVALVAVVIAAVVTTVVMLTGGSQAVTRKDNAPAPPPPVVADAAVPAAEIDAAPDVETLDVTIVTEPPGATVQVDGIEKGQSPVTVKLIVDKHHTEVTASAQGYDDTTISFSTLVDKSRTHTIKLRKTARGAAPGGRPGPRATTPPRGTDAAGESRDKQPNKTGGELNGNPFKSGALPTKKP